MRLVKQILTAARKDTFDNITLTSPMASSSRIETTEKTNLISKEKSSMVTSVDPQASGNSRGQIRRVLSYHERIVPNDTHGKVAKGLSSSLSKEKPSTVTFNSQTSDPPDQICQKLSFQAKISSDDVQKKDVKEPILITESSMPSDSKTEISEELNLTSVDSSSAPADATIVSETKLNTKVIKRIT